MNKRTVVSALAALVAGAGLTAGQDSEPGAKASRGLFSRAPFSNVQPLPEPTPRPTVIAAPPPAEMPPLAPPPAAVPVPPPPVPDPEPIPVEPTPVVVETPALVEEKPTYSTHVLDSIMPWTAHGRRSCGSVYVATPYAWLNVDYSVSWLKSDRTVPLVTTGPANATNAGVLGEPGTRVLFDGQNLHDQPFFGGRLYGGIWFDECQYCGADLGYFFLGAEDRDFISAANGFPGLPGLFVPFFNPLTGTEDAFAVANPGNASGIIRINSRTQLQGLEGHGLCSLSRGWNFRIDGMIGVRWLGLDEAITVEENVREFRFRQFDIPTDVGIFDRFSTSSSFVGADIGLKAHFEKYCWSFDLLARIAVGGTYQQIRNDGFTGVTFPNFPTAIGQGGRLTGPANLGTFTSDSFSYVPELGAMISWQPRHWLRWTVGYNWLYWTDVVRPGPQIDRVINPVGVQTRGEFRTDALYEPQRPGVAFRESDIWMQSATVGLQILY